MEGVRRSITTIIEENIPSGKKALQDSHKNLAEIADYCERQYVSVNNTYKANDKKKALEETRAVFTETKQYATQSLASVAYQIHALAASVLDLLDNQASQFNQMNSDISYISNVVQVHKEKVARREIGVLASSKNTSRGHKIIAPPQREQPKRYERQPIDYNSLDSIGHGRKTNVNENKRTPSIRSHNSTSSTPTTPTPVVAPKAVTTGNLRVRTRNQAPPSAPPPPPEIPKIPSNQHEVSKAPIGSPPPPPMPPIGSPPPPPMPPIGPPPSYSMHPVVAPPPPPITGSPKDLLPPPPIPNLPTDDGTMSPGDDGNQSSSPDCLPAPPSAFTGEENSSGQFSPLPPPPPELNDETYSFPSLWIPETYEEKVISIYEYEATREDELSFKEGEIIYVLKKNEDGWYEGVMNGMTGLFPGNYVETSS